MNMAKTPSISSVHDRDTLRPPSAETHTPNDPSAASDTHLPLPHRSPELSLSDPPMEEPRCGRRQSNRAWIADQERRIEREIVGTICSGRTESLKPNSGKAITVGEHYVCVSFHDGVDPSCRTWEWHGHVTTFDENNQYSPEHFYGNYLERVGSESWYGEEDEEEDEESSEDSSIPIVLGNVNLRFNRFN